MQTLQSGKIPNLKNRKENITKQKKYNNHAYITKIFVLNESKQLKKNGNKTKNQQLKTLVYVAF